MRIIGHLFKSSPSHARAKRDEEARFLRLYSTWHETHNLSLRKRLFSRLGTVMRRIPNFNLRRRFEQAF